MKPKPIIPPVDKELLKAELDESRLLRETNRAGNKLYIVRGWECPNVMNEIGRLREIAFRDGGGGTGEPLDIDKFDTNPAYGYSQLVLWDPSEEAIIGGYRIALCDEIVFDTKGQPIITSAHMFEFSKKFIKEYLPYTMELGRSFVSLDYQSSKLGAKGIFALDNLFDGLAALMVHYKGRMKYFFGKATIYPDFNEQARDLIQYFLRKHFGMKRNLLRIRKEVPVKYARRWRHILTGSDFKEDYKILNTEVRKMGVNIPPLVNSYMNLSSSMIYFGTGINDEFADIYDSGIMIDFDDMYPEKKKRHVESFKEGYIHLKERLRKFRKKHL